MIQSLLHILFFTLATASPVPQYGQSAASNCPDYCAGTAYNASLEQTYICGDYRLGPVTLPSRLPISDLVDDYKRFGDLCPGEFLKKWYYDVAATWVYPPLGGYLLNTDGLPIKGNVSLKVGWLLDRFGSEYGSFVSPEGAPYNQRALPPSNLNTPVDDTRFPSNYHVYRVVKNFVAMAGPIEGWFEQPGQGVQYQLYDNVRTLLKDGYLVAVNLDNL